MSAAASTEMAPITKYGAARRLRLLGDRVLLKVDLPATTTAAGLAIPDRAQEHDATVRAEVLAIGPGKDREAPCGHCHGTGQSGVIFVKGGTDEPVTCRKCEGTGVLRWRSLSVDVRAGDVVHIHATTNLADEEVQIDGATFHVVRSARCLCVLEPGA